MVKRQHKTIMRNNWFTTLMSSDGSHPEAAYKLLVSDASPFLDINAIVNGKPVIGWLERSRVYQPYYWANLATKEERRQYQTRWTTPGTPLPLSTNEPDSDTVSFPDSPRENKNPRLDIREALFAKLLQMGADPWVPWENENGKVDGFDLAMGTGCLPLIEACLRHPSRPDMSKLYRRTPWNILSGIPHYKSKDGAGKGLMSPKDTLVHAAAASGQNDLLKVLLKNGWETDPGVGKYSPLAMAQNSDVVKILLDAGAMWDDQIISHWDIWASRFISHKSTLAQRIELVSSMALTTQHNEILSKNAVDAFKKKDFPRFYKTLEAAWGDKGKEENMGMLENARALCDLKEYNLPGKAGASKKASPILLVLLHAMGRSSMEHKNTALRMITKLAIESPDKKLWGQVIVNGIALVLYHAWTQMSRNGSARSYLISDWISESKKIDPKKKVKQANQAAIFFYQNGNATVRDYVITSMRVMARELAIRDDIEPIMEGLDFFNETGFDSDDFTYVSNWLSKQPIELHLAWGPMLVRANVGNKTQDKKYWVGGMNKHLWALSSHLDRAIENREMKPEAYAKLEDLVMSIDKDKFNENGYDDLAAFFKNRLLAQSVDHNSKRSEKTLSAPPKM